ncbi:hypothetical protein [Xanthocytophaga agilis]|uniref:Uncharacterized protein n=1 Tax=Xanthocytophaga agilis TaxID=3048010 RepID=A0AAE3UK08_9BACT|nr:hypothetical protein [Xanthocytophaga agilis]MDJ1506912.1 hypothetical protein [Xanthocytophaga agilis]
MKADELPIKVKAEEAPSIIPQDSKEKKSYCDDETEKDKFNGTVKHFTPYLEPVQFFKNIKNGVTVYYLALTTEGSTANFGKKGVVILLNNGKKLSRPAEKINLEVSGGKYKYSVFLQLTPTEIATLRATEMTDFRLFIYDQENINGCRYKVLFNCLLLKK